MLEHSLSQSEAASAIERAAANSPQRTPVSEVAPTREHLHTVLQLFADWYLNLYLAPAPFAAEPGEYPETSPLARAMLAMGEQSVASLDHQLARVDLPEVRELLRAADGRKTIGELAGIGHGVHADKVMEVLKLAAKEALLTR